MVQVEEEDVPADLELPSVASSFPVTDALASENEAAADLSLRNYLQ